MGDNRARRLTNLIAVVVHIMLRDLLTQKCGDKKKLLILDTPEHVDSENIKLKIGSWSLLDRLFSKHDF
jgi:hypothetical protein